MLRLGTVLAGFAATIIACLILASGAQAAFMLEGRDRAADATTGHAGHDIVKFGFSYDPRSGRIMGAVNLGSTPHWEHPATLLVIAGMRQGNRCTGHPSAGFISPLGDWQAQWLRMRTATNYLGGEADKRGAGSAVQTFDATDRRLRGMRWNCLFVAVVDPDDANIVYDEAHAFGFRGLPELSMRVPQVRNPVRPGQTRRLRITIRNPGDGPIRNLRLRITQPRGMKVAPRTRLIRRIKPRGRATVTVRVTTTGRASYSSRLRVTARAGKLTATDTIKLERRRPQPKPRGGGGGGGGTGQGPSTCLRYQPDLSGQTGGSLIMVPC